MSGGVGYRDQFFCSRPSSSASRFFELLQALLQLLLALPEAQDARSLGPLRHLDPEALEVLKLLRVELDDHVLAIPALPEHRRQVDLRSLALGDRRAHVERPAVADDLEGDAVPRLALADRGRRFPTVVDLLAVHRGDDVADLQARARGGAALLHLAHQHAGILRRAEVGAQLGRHLDEADAEEAAAEEELAAGTQAADDDLAALLGRGAAPFLRRIGERGAGGGGGHRGDGERQRRGADDLEETVLHDGYPL